MGRDVLGRGRETPEKVVEKGYRITIEKLLKKSDILAKRKNRLEEERGEKQRVK